MKKPIVIWIIGSNGSGKTTQAKLLGNFFKTEPLKIIEGTENNINWAYSTYGNKIANVGRVQNNPCCGTDTLQTKEQIRLSYLKAITNHKIVILDGIMASGAWLEFINEVETNILLVLLDIDINDNLKRIRARRSAKNADKEIIINPSTVENLKGKIKGFKSLYNNLSDKIDNKIIIEAKSNVSDVNNRILKELKKLV